IPRARPTGSGNSLSASPESGSTSVRRPSATTIGRMRSSSRSVRTEYGAGKGSPSGRPHETRRPARAASGSRGRALRDRGNARPPRGRLASPRCSNGSPHSSRTPGRRATPRRASSDRGRRRAPPPRSGGRAGERLRPTPPGRRRRGDRSSPRHRPPRSCGDSVPGCERLPRLDGEPELHPLLGVVGMPPGLLAQSVHAVAERMPVDAEPRGRVAPAAAGVEQGGQGVQQAGARGRGTENAVDERLERGVRQAEKKLERSEVAVGRDFPARRVEGRPRLEQAPPERAAARRTADADARPPLRPRDPPRELERLVLSSDLHEEGGPLAAGGGQGGDRAAGGAPPPPP